MTTKNIKLWIKKYPNLSRYESELNEKVDDNNIKWCSIRYGDYCEYEFEKLPDFDDIPKEGWLIFIENQNITEVIKLGDLRDNKKSTKLYGILLNIEGLDSPYIALFDDIMKSKDLILKLLKIENNRYDDFQKKGKDSIYSSYNSFDENYNGVSVIEYNGKKGKIMGDFSTNYVIEQTKNIKKTLESFGAVFGEDL